MQEKKTSPVQFGDSFALHSHDVRTGVKKGILVLTTSSARFIRRRDALGLVPEELSLNEVPPENTLSVTFGRNTEIFYGPWANKQRCGCCCPLSLSLSMLFFPLYSPLSSVRSILVTLRFNGTTR